MNMFGQNFSEALQQQVTEDSVPIMPIERDTTFRGQIGWAMARNVFRLFTDTQLSSFDFAVKMNEGDSAYTGVVEFNGKEYRLSTTRSGGTFVWFDNVVTAGQMREIIVDADGKAYVFTERELVMPTDKIIYWGSDRLKEIVESRGGDYAISVGITGMSQWKRGFNNFVKMHLLYLPAMVSALAKWGQRAGMTSSDVDFDEVWSSTPLFTSAQYDEDRTMFYTEEAQRELVGDDDGFEESIMFQQRAALWKLFDEENPLAYMPGRDSGKYGMTSDSLRSVIEYGMGEWKSPALVAVTNVPVPIHNEVDDNGFPYRQYIIVEWFKDEEEAHAFLANSSEITAEPQDGKSLPEAWVGMRKEWEEAITDLKSRTDNPDEIQASTLELLQVTLEEIKEWW